MKNRISKWLLSVVLLTLFALNFAFAIDEGYVYWTSIDRRGDEGVSSLNDNNYLTHKFLKRGTRVRLTVNGISKDYTVSDYTRDRNALVGVSSEDAKNMGFYYTGKEQCEVEVLSGVYSQNDDVKWYDITGLLPRSNSTSLELLSYLKKQGYKVEINTSDFSLTVKYIPEYLLEHEVETLKEIVSPASRIQTTKTSVIL